MTVRTLSNRTITKEELNNLDNRLFFATTNMTPPPTQQLQLLHKSSDFTKSPCQIYVHKQHYRTNTHQLKSLPLTATAKVSLNNCKTALTIKPADKNLGTVIMDTDDYIKQCMILLPNTNIYTQKD